MYIVVSPKRGVKLGKIGDLGNIGDLVKIGKMGGLPITEFLCFPYLSASKKERVGKSLYIE